MRISEIDFYPIRRANDGHLGFVNFLVDGALFVNGVAVFSRRDGQGIRLVWPDRKLSGGRKITLVRPVSREVADLIEQQVSAALAER